ncbi:MAG: acyl-CoA thioesterase [Gammaproteobacteria bacterium]|nr:acyl-CoA thioesterase [Gammaproteobacteria bacterium]
MMQVKKKLVSESALENQVYQVFPGDLNPNNTLFGGHVMALMDSVAYTIATTHSGNVCVTACVDHINFIKPARLGDKILISGSVNRSWKTSLEVGIKVCKQNIKGGEIEQILKAYLVFVAIDQDGMPVEVPELVSQSEEEHKRFMSAELRREKRNSRRKRD